MNYKRTAGLILLCAMALSLLGTGCGSNKQEEEEVFASLKQTSDEAKAEEEKYQRQVFAMDTVMMLTAYGPHAEEALDAAEQEIYALEADLDPESRDGSIYALNNTGNGTMTPVSEDSLAVLHTALEVRGLTGGALDPAMYMLSKTWGFIGGNYRVPFPDEIEAMLPGDVSDYIQIDEEAGAAAVPMGVEVGFGAVAKGYTAQKVVDLMRDMGVQSAILSLGGNVQTLGENKPDGSSWQVAVQDPNDTGSYVGILTVGEAAVVTSGGYQRYFEEDGVTYIHILDPETGYPVDNDLLSVTVVTEDGARADAFSTALFVLGKDRALEYYTSQEELELVLITKDNEVIITPGLAEAFSERGEGYTYEYLS